MLIVYPKRPPPKEPLTAFISRGGRLAIADDFGAADDLLASLGVQRAPAAASNSRRLRGNRNLLIATPNRAHPLSANVATLVTNHPSMLRHPTLDPIFGFGGKRDAVVISGSVGLGRLVAIGDPSVLINNMLEFRGNHEFASNLVRYLAPAARLWVAGPETEFVGSYTDAGTDPVGSVRKGLQRIATLALPEAALRFSAVVVVALLLLAAWNAAPRRTTYLRAVSLPAAETYAGFAGRMRWFGRPRANLLGPALTYKHELERRLIHAFALASQPSLRQVTAALETAGMPQARVREANALLIELQRLALAEERQSPAPKLSERKLRAILSTGDHILAFLDEQKARALRS
jgi:hypothetical protein